MSFSEGLPYELPTHQRKAIIGVGDLQIGSLDGRGLVVGRCRVARRELQDMQVALRAIDSVTRYHRRGGGETS